MEDLPTNNIGLPLSSNSITQENYWEWIDGVDENDSNYFEFMQLRERVFTINSNHLPFIILLNELELPINEWMNYESNYLASVMDIDTREVRHAVRRAKKIFLEKFDQIGGIPQILIENLDSIFESTVPQ
ncbi:MAG: hypothetical protein U9R58_02305 [Chloroflexota bacterium]|nr:hypothetical protein [Chloroflexota bacterium]